MNFIPWAIYNLRTHWRAIAFAVLAVTILTLTLLLRGSWDRLEAEKAGRLADRAEYARAQAEARSLALSNKLKVEAEYARKADEADSRYADLGDQYRAAVLRYKAAQGAAGRSDLPSATQAAESLDQSGGGAVIPLGTILIPENDAFICADNTARLQSAHEWALSLDD